MPDVKTQHLEHFSDWAKDTATSLMFGVPPKPLLPGQRLSRDEAELALRLLKEELEHVGINIELGHEHYFSDMRHLPRKALRRY